MKRIPFFGVILITLFIYSCNRKPFTESVDNRTEIVQLNNSHFVSLDMALQIAHKQKSPLDKSSTIEEYFEFKKKGDLAEFYIINYCKSGFAIISADDRLTPVLAYSENTHFPLRDNNRPYGVTDWLNSTSALIDSIRNNKMGQDIFAKHHWKSARIGNNNLKSEVMSSSTTQSGNISSIIYEYGEGYDQDNCGSEGQVIAEYYIFVDQLLTTYWSQYDGFNDSIPYGACNTTTNGKYPVGCAPVAVGQVMNFNHYPSSFNWNSINAGGVATNVFLRDLGLPANLNLQYSCNGSSVTTDIVISYLQSVGYTYTAGTNTNDVSLITSNLSYSHPVIISGGGHMWVCDGIQSYYDVVCFASGACYDTRSDINMNRQMLHMNWGYGSWYDAWYSIWDFTPGTHDYNPDRAFIYNIRY